MAAEVIFSVYVVLDDSCLAPGLFAAAAAAASDGGATVLQFRSKKLCDAERLSAIREILQVTVERGVPLLVNDRADLALDSGADGVHLGAGDIPIEVARRLLGPDAIIGGTAHSIEEAVLAEKNGADYISAGCIFTSVTKPALAPAGPGLIEDIAGAVSVPVVAIGGITPENARTAIEAGAGGVVSVSYVWNSPDWRKAVAELAAAVQRQREEGNVSREALFLDSQGEE